MKIWEIHRKLQTCDPASSPTPYASPLPSPLDEDAVCGNPIILDAGETSVIVPLNFVYEAMITKLIVRRSYPAALAGPTNFTVDLFNSIITEDTLDDLGAIARVIPQQTATIDATMELFAGDSGAGWSFMNMDSGPTVQTRRIYARIAVTGGTPTAMSTWDLALAGIMTGQGT